MILSLLAVVSCSLGKKSSNKEVLVVNQVKDEQQKVKKVLSKINDKDEHGKTRLHKAVIDGDINLVQKFLKDRANINIQDNVGQAPIHFACLKKDIEILKLLLGKGADINIKDRDGQTPLHLAARSSEEISNILINRGADINARDLQGQTPIYESIFYENMNIFNLLMDKEVNTKLLDKDGETIINFASSRLHSLKDNNFFDYLVAILSLHIDIHKPNNNGETPLHKVVIDKDNIKAVELLLNRGANINAKDKKGNTPLHKAKMAYNNNIAELLIKAGAN